MKLTGTRHINAEGRVIDADEITIAAHAGHAEQPISTCRLELRGNSRITGGGGGSGPQAMSARDIDLTYAEDGRTLQHAQLIENAVVQLPGDEGSRAAASPARRSTSRWRRTARPSRA